MKASYEHNAEAEKIAQKIREYFKKEWKCQTIQKKCQAPQKKK